MAKTIYAGKTPQRVRKFFGKENGLVCTEIADMCLNDGVLYAATADGIFVFENEKFKKIADGDFKELFKALDGTVYVSSGKTLYIVTKKGVSPFAEFEGEIRGMAQDGNSTVWLTTADFLYRLDGKKFTQYADIERSCVDKITAFGNQRIFCSTDNSLMGLWGVRPRWGSILPETSDMPDAKVTVLKADGCGYLWIGTEQGVYIYDCCSSWVSHEYIDALPQESITSIDFYGSKTYIGTTIGLYVLDGAQKSFIGAMRWLPCRHVTCCVADEDGADLWVGTKDGIARIQTKMMTLEEKALHFSEVAQKYHTREGYHTPRILTEYGNNESGAPCITDNDGLRTASYVMAEACRYAVTKDEQALEYARAGMRAVLKLNKITGISGFPARAYRRPGERGYGDGDPECFPATDEIGPLEWRGETSSDETSGHFFGLAYYYDLCANDEEKKEISDVLCAMTDHILAHNYTLCSVDGKPTTWGRWTPEWLNRYDMWKWERGVNSLEMLCMLKVCYHMSGDEKYQTEYMRLIAEEHFALNCARHKMEDAHTSHIDDHLGFILAPTILRYEHDPRIRTYLLFGLRHHWTYEAIERCPFYNIVYGAFTGDCCNLDVAVDSLEKLPLDFTDYPTLNEGRKDLVYDVGQEYYGGPNYPKQLREPLPYDEKPITNFDDNPFWINEGNGMRMCLPTVYLVPYWLGRLYGLLGD